MSPEPDAEVIVCAAIASAIRRARLVAVAEAVAWGVAAAAISVMAGALVAIAVAVWRWRTTSRVAIVRALEHAHADSRNLLITADELIFATLAARGESRSTGCETPEGHRERGDTAPSLAGRADFHHGLLGARPLVRARVFADAAAIAHRLDLRAAFPIARVGQVALLAGVAWATVGTVAVWRGQFPRAGAGVLSRSTSPTNTAARMRLRVSVATQPPAYTGLGETREVDPEQLQAVEGSTLVLSIDSSAARVSIEHDGRTRALARGADGRFADRLQVTKTGYVLVTADEGTRRMMPVIVSPDALPSVRLTAPGRDLVYSGGNPRIAFDARATDDFGLRSLVLRYMKVTGSGENFDFQEGEIPLTVHAASARDWIGGASRSLAELNLRDGDMLVYRAVAADARPGDGSASSDAFFIEISKLGAAAGDAFTLPQEETKYALSQQMLIVKTGRLQQRRASLPPGELTEQALNLAVEQRMIRAEFVFMLGGEIDDEEVEAEQSVELQAGRLQNRGQRDLRAATIAMSQAEKLLTGANTAEALIAERAAVTALQRAFSRDRYILRALATRGQLDPARRLTGNQAEATGWRRIPPDVPANRRTALLQDILRGIGELIEVRLKPDTTNTTVRLKPDTTNTTVRLKPDTTNTTVRLKPDTTETPSDTQVVSGFSRTRAIVLAEEAIRIDPGAALLRQTATELQRAAETTDASVRSRALAAAATAAASEARRAHAGAPLASPAVAPALTGAFADAMRRER